MDGHIEMVLADDGVGLPDTIVPSSCTSMGMKLIHTLVEHQLRGSIKIESKQGVRYQITIPFKEECKS
jgi:two-component sensor histidine kinase